MNILTINAGSSSLKFAIYRHGEPPVEVLRGKIERVTSAGAELVVTSDDGRHERVAISANNSEQMATALIEWLEAHAGLTRPVSIGHRIVHGGPNHTIPALITPELIRDIVNLKALDPTHLPAELDLISGFAIHWPGVPQVACFDTSFHRDLPAAARALPIPRRYQAQGVRRYGFHGLSYEYLMEELARVAGETAASGPHILAHLGSGASLAAVHFGKCVDTTMGFTPTGGLVMGTRTGDLDPGVLLHLARTEGLATGQLDALVNRESGLLGLSETSHDVRELLVRESQDPRAADAIAVFCYQTRKWIGAMAASLSGVDTLVFSGGIGENSSVIRSRICNHLGFLGVTIVEDRNNANAVLLSTDDASVKVRVIRTNEESMIARIVQRVLGHTHPTTKASNNG